VPDLGALKSAARAAIVIPAVFALADKVIQQPQTSIFAAFGSFALLVLVEFAGPPRTRLLAYVGLACAGAAFITLGTLCSRNAWVGAGVMAVVGFATLFSGVISGYFAAAATGAILTFVLPVTIPAPNSAIPDRLEGWGLAVGASVCASMLLWPPRGRANLQRAAADALRAVANFVDAARDGAAEHARLARDAVDDLGRRLLGTQHRPTGPTGTTAALAALPEELDWLLSFLTPSAELPELELACAEDAEAMAAAAAVLRAGAARLEGGDERPDFTRLDAARVAVARALARRLPELPADTGDDALLEALDPPFRIRVATYSARQIAGYALLATGADAPEAAVRAAMLAQLAGFARGWSGVGVELAEHLVAATSRSLRRSERRSRRPSRLRSSTPARGRCGSRTASAAQSGSGSPCSSPSGQASSTASGSCSERSPCCGRTRSAPAGRFSARSPGPPSDSSWARCS